MTRIAAALLALLSFVALDARAQITVSQATGVTCDASSDCLVPAGAGTISVTINNLIVIAAGKDQDVNDFEADDCSKNSGTAAIETPTLDQSQSFDIGGGLSFRRTGLWSARVTTGGTLQLHCVTNSGGGANYWHIGVVELAAVSGWGVAASRKENGANGSNATDGTTSAASATVASAASGILIGSLASEGPGTTVTITPTSATTIFEQEDSSAHLIGSSAYRIRSAAATDTMAWTIGSGNLGWGVSAVAYKEVTPTGGGGGTIVNPISGKGGAAARPLVN